ncbi:MAG: TolC family protein [Candidatus Gastranaerophilales bacterium]|nr:TolC family protein [Candidatus Gastranaerophilales bacterium]
MKRKIYLLILILAVFLTSGKTYAIEEITPGAMLSVDDCIELAIKNSPEIQIYQNYVDMYNSRIGQSKSNYFPSIGASAGYDLSNTESKYRSNNSKNFSAQVYLNQLIYSFGKVFSQVKMQKFYKIAAEYDLQNAIIAAANNVKSAYYGVLASKANIDIARANLLVNERQYSRTKAFYDEGLVSRIDVVNQEVYLSDAQISLVTAENDYQNSIVTLNNAMYITDSPDYQIENTETFNFKDNFAEINLLNVANTTTKEDGTVEPKEAVLTTQVEKTEILENYKFVPYPYTLKESIERAYENRSDLHSMEATEKAVKEALKYTRKEYFPDLTGQVGYNWGNNLYYSTNGINVAAYLSTSNLNIMETKYKIKESKSELEIAKKNVELTKKNIYFEVQNAYINLIKLEKNIPILKTKVKQTLENYELADARYEVGLGNFIELQDAKENYNNAQRDYVENIYNYNVALADLQAAMGER